MIEPRIEVLSTGDELVDGGTADTNAAEIAAALGEAGRRVASCHAVGDEPAEVAALLRGMMQRCDVCICTGGLGPTRDDITREAVARVCGRQLELDDASLRAVRERYAKYGRAMPESSQRQAMFPEGAEILPNNYGTAPGFALECGGALVVCMPGVPREMRHMLRESVLPLLRKHLPPARHIRTKVLRLFGISESSLADTLGEMMERGRNPSVGTSAGQGVISIITRSHGDGPGAVEQALARTEDRIRALVGKHIFGEGRATLEEAVAQLLERHDTTIATAESCTGGMIGSVLTNVPGISRFYLGGIICYGNEAKVELLGVPPEVLRSQGAVSEDVARALAEGVRKRLGSDIGIGVTGIAGPSGGSPDKPVGLVYIAVADDDGTESREFRFSGDRRAIRLRTALTALNMTRRRLIAQGQG
jgi:nicotinamide-nucleotide amidase